MKDSISSLIQQHLGVQFESVTSLGGGSQATVEKVQTTDGKAFVVKTGTTSDRFEKEANGLKELAQAGSIYIPKVLMVSDQVLVTEYLGKAPMKTGAMYEFGRNFAKMHRFTAPHFGFYEDNYLGDAPQINAVGEKIMDWSTFYWTYRLEFQIHWGKREGRFSDQFLKKVESLKSVCREILTDADHTPRLLHGDLWGGNYIINQYGEVSIIDPAVYYGHREADLAMTKLFGGFPPEFYQGYQEEFPLEPGWADREDLYKLYHILNHYNLFGGGYLMQAEHIINQYLN